MFLEMKLHFLKADNVIKMWIPFLFQECCLTEEGLRSPKPLLGLMIL